MLFRSTNSSLTPGQMANSNCTAPYSRYADLQPAKRALFGSLRRTYFFEKNVFLADVGTYVPQQVGLFCSSMQGEPKQWVFSGRGERSSALIHCEWELLHSICCESLCGKGAELSRTRNVCTLTSAGPDLAPSHARNTFSLHAFTKHGAWLLPEGAIKAWTYAHHYYSIPTIFMHDLDLFYFSKPVFNTIGSAETKKLIQSLLLCAACLSGWKCKNVRMHEVYQKCH